MMRRKKAREKDEGRKENGGKDKKGTAKARGWENVQKDLPLCL